MKNSIAKELMEFGVKFDISNKISLKMYVGS